MESFFAVPRLSRNKLASARTLPVALVSFLLFLFPLWFRLLHVNSLLAFAQVRGCGLCVALFVFWLKDAHGQTKIYVFFAG